MRAAAPLRLALALAAAFAAGGALAQPPAPASAQPSTPPAEPSFDAQFSAARQLVRDGKREEALAAYTALLSRSPGNSDVLLARGRLYGWMDRWPEAEADLSAVTRSSPRYGDAWSALGDLYRWTDRPALAADAYQHWEEAAPKDPAPHLARGRMLRLAGDTGGARAEFEAARTLGAAPADVARAIDTLQPKALAPDVVAPQGFLWSATLSGSKTWVSDGGLSDYRNYGVSMRRHFDTGSLAFEALEVRRFDKSDTAYALDGYTDLWDRAYANVRFQIAPDHRLFPQNSGRIELYQGVGRGWELAASDDWLQFSSNVNILGFAVAKYVGNYYGRLRTTYVAPSGSLGWRLTLRDYYRGDADHYLELTGGAGRGNIDSRGVSTLEWSQSVGLGWVSYWNPRWGYRVGADYSYSGHTENSVSASLYMRW